MGTSPRPSPSSGRDGSRALDPARMAAAEAGPKDGAPAEEPGTLEDATESLAPAISPWSDSLGRAGSRAAQTVLIAAVVVGLIWVLLRIKVVVIAVLVALILASAVGPAVRWLERKGWSNLLATLTAFLGILVLVGGIVTGVVFAVRSQWDELTGSATQGWQQLQQWLNSAPLPVDTGAVDQAFGQISQYATSGTFGQTALSGLSAATTFLTGLVLMIISLFFFLKDGAKIWNFALRWFRGERRAKLAESADRSAQVLGGYVRGTALVALIDAVLIGIGLAIVGVPLALPLAVIVFVTAFIPVIGATIAGVLAALVALFTNGLVAALIVVGIVVLVNQIEGNILQPIIMGHTLSLHALVVLLALTVGTLVGGIIGAILAVPYTAVGWAVIQVWTDRYQAGHDPVLGPDPLDPDERAQSKATMAQRWKYQRMRLQAMGGAKLGAVKQDTARAEDLQEGGPATGSEDSPEKP